MFELRRSMWIVASFASVLLVACGGGGGGSSGGSSGPPPTFTVGGTASGLVGTGLALSLNGGTALNVTANGAFTFSGALTSGTAYTVTIATQPTNPAQTCTLAGATGTIGNGNVTSVAVNCPAPTFTIGGTVSGLLGSGLTLRLNGGTPLAVTAGAGTFTFPTAVATGGAYTVTVDGQPTLPTQTCTVSGGTGNVASANVTNVTVACSAPPSGAGNVQNCKLTNPQPEFALALGFPRGSKRMKLAGTVRVTVLFVDFPDVAATQTPQQVFAQISPTSENYYAAVSYGAMTLVYQPEFRWLRMSKASNTYGFGSLTFFQQKAYMEEAIALAGAGVDYSATDALLVVGTPNATALVNGPAFVANTGFAIVAGGREIYNGATSGADLPVWGGYWANHEFGHALGLPDLYANTQPFHRLVGIFSMMGDIAGPAREFTAFERWIIGWVNDTQVACVTATGESVTTLSPIERAGGTKMAVVPLSTTTAVVAESRRPEGFDAGFTGGVLVYFVDSSLSNSQGAMRVLPINDTDVRKTSAILTPGGSITHLGATVRVLTSGASGDTVLITR